MLIQKSEAKNMYLYADDIKIFNEIRSEEDIQELQLTIDKMYDWTFYSLLPFHPDKSVTMRLNANRFSSKLSKGFYNMDSMKLKEVKLEKDMGVYVDDNLV